MIVTLPFPTLHICDPNNPKDALWFHSLESFDPVEETSVEYRPTAAGSTRAFISPYVKRTFAASTSGATLAEHQWLRDHRGVHLLFRFRDVRMFGMYERYHGFPIPQVNWYQVDFTVTEVSFVEAV